MLQTFAAALLSPWSALPGLVAGLATFALIVWLPNLGLIWSVATGGSMSLSGKIAFLWSSLGAIGTNFTTLAASLTVAVAALLGLNVAVAARHIRRQAAQAHAGGAALGGVTLALLGVGCSSCGAIVLSSLLGASAAASFTASLPLAGQELSILSVTALAATLVVTVRKASQPVLCAVEPASARGQRQSSGSHSASTQSAHGDRATRGPGQQEREDPSQRKHSRISSA